MKRFSLPDSENPFPPLTIVTLLVLLILILSLAGTGGLYFYHQLRGTSFEALIENLSPMSPVSDRNLVRFSLLINHMSMFILPPFLLGWLLFKSSWSRFLCLDRLPNLKNLLLGGCFVLAALPLAHFTFWLNQQVPLPEWAVSMEANTNNLISNLLISEHLYELFLNLLVVAVIPALGEEWVFRGVLQRNLHRSLENPHLSIWISALIFSGIHLQFEGFLPRVILGGLLGYLFFWTKNLWVPIFAHFVYNGIQVFAQYTYQKELSNFNPDNIESVNWGLSIISFIFVVIIGYSIFNNNQKTLST